MTAKPKEPAELVAEVRERLTAIAGRVLQPWNDSGALLESKRGRETGR